jgi:hypothetical protein
MNVTAQACTAGARTFLSAATFESHRAADLVRIFDGAVLLRTGMSALRRSSVRAYA